MSAVHPVEFSPLRIFLKTIAARAYPRVMAANRANAARSTGPRTEQGKANSSKNALKHGLLAADAVNSHLADPGDRAQFDQLVDQMQRLYQPVGLMEELMVQKIAIAAWRLKKAMRFEAQTSFEIWRINREVGDARKAMAMGTTEAGDLTIGTGKQGERTLVRGSTSRMNHELSQFLSTLAPPEEVRQSVPGPGVSGAG